MKKYFIFAAAALAAMCSCTKNELDSSIADQEISFQVANYAEGTKATGTGSDAFLATGNTSFGVYAFYNTVDWSSASSPVANKFMDNVEITHGGAGKGTATNEDWAPATKYYWPKTGKLTFVGWAPYSKTPSYTKDAGYTWTDFTIDPAPSSTKGSGNKIDLMYATEAFNQTANTTTYGHSGVPMLFNHALAKLNFNLTYDMSALQDNQKSMFKVQVTKLTLKTLGNKATYTNSAWGTPSASANQVLKSTASNELTSTSASQNNFVTDYFIIPQAPVKLIVEYKVNGIACDAEEISLATSSITTWAKNNVYTYTVKISPVKNDDNDKPITFDPSVTSWATATTGDIKVK